MEVRNVNRLTTFAFGLASCSIGALCGAPPVCSQPSGTDRGAILDPSQTIITNATVEIQNPSPQPCGEARSDKVRETRQGHDLKDNQELRFSRMQPRILREQLLRL
jgi:hypothetical protein